MNSFTRSAPWKFHMAQLNVNGALPEGFARLREVTHITLHAEWMKFVIFDILTCNMDAGKDVLTGIQGNLTEQQ